MSNEVRSQTMLAHGIKLKLVLGDITKEQVDAIVNAANEQLQHGGGVAAAIASAGGPVIQKQSNQWIQQHGPISHRQPAITEGGQLPSQFVIHVVGPRWGEGQEADKLHNAVIGALEMAEAKGFQSLALPAISTGIFGYPVEEAAQVMIEAIDGFAKRTENPNLEQVRITLFDQKTLEPFQRALGAD